MLKALGVVAPSVAAQLVLSSPFHCYFLYAVSLCHVYLFLKKQLPDCQPFLLTPLQLIAATPRCIKLGNPWFRAS